MTVSTRLRYEVMRRDDFACRYCHRQDLPLTIDHVVPVALGGPDVPENLVTACEECNAGKTSSVPDAPVVAGVSDDAIRWAAAMREAAEVQRADAQACAEYCSGFFEEWSRWWSWPPPSDWRSTVESLVRDRDRA